MHGDAALSEEIRLKMFPHSRLKGEANLLIMPTLDASNIAFNLLKTASSPAAQTDQKKSLRQAKPGRGGSRS